MPSPLTHTQLSVLRTRFLKLIDNFNSNDLTGTNSSGEVADICLNEGLQTIYSDIKSSHFLDGYSNTNLVSVADQPYIDLTVVSDLDSLLALKDTENDITLEEIPAWQYHQEVPDPSQSTGTPYRYARINERIYLDPRPTTAITYTSEYKKTEARMTLDQDTPLIPSKYDPWIYEEARVKWLMMEDISNIAAIGEAKSERDRVRQIFLDDIGSQFNQVTVSQSHFKGRRSPGNPYNHL